MTNLIILVFSDSHHSLSGMYEAIEQHQPQQVIHLGDLLCDAQEVALAYPHLPFCLVPGNCDSQLSQPLKKQITLAGKDILLSHGHVWNVKSTYAMALADARACAVDMLLFGHTHLPLCRQEADGLWVLNPGPSSTSYGLIRIEAGVISPQLFQFNH